jgi:hypothetical protein
MGTRLQGCRERAPGGRAGSCSQCAPCPPRGSRRRGRKAANLLGRLPRAAVDALLLLRRLLLLLQGALHLKPGLDCVGWICASGTAGFREAGAEA